MDQEPGGCRHGPREAAGEAAALPDFLSQRRQGTPGAAGGSDPWGQRSPGLPRETPGGSAGETGDPEDRGKRRSRVRFHDAMNLFQTIASRVVAEWCAQRSGRRALREVRFAKYRIQPTDATWLIRERLLHRLAPRACGSAATS